MRERPCQLALLTAVALAVVGAGCVTRPRCEGSWCDGCCDVNDRCRTGQEPQACGALGGACQACAPSLECRAGACQAPLPPPDAGPVVVDAGPPDAGRPCRLGCGGDLPVCDEDSQLCVGCTSNVHCVPPDTLCNPERKRCEECLGSAGCPTERPYCDARRSPARCLECQRDADCLGGRGLCDVVLGRCQRCLPGRGCPAALPVCETSFPGARCVECLSSSHCPLALPFCDVLRRRCSDTATLLPKLTAGASHACALFDTELRCWGANAAGQLGDGRTTTQPRPVPVAASGPPDLVTACAGVQHTCAVASTGAVRCVGANEAGQLGDGSAVTRLVLVQASGLSADAITVSCGGHHTCAALRTGELRCWGDNTWGQVGEGTFGRKLVPVTARLDAGVREVSAGAQHTCALDVAGRVHCWGANGDGQLGTGDTSSSAVPRLVTGLPGPATSVAAGGGSSCAVVAQAAWCWGSNAEGQLGTTPSRLPQPTPVRLTGLSEVRALSLGTAHACAIVRNAEVRCWGLNASGELGDGTLTSRVEPAAPVGLGQVNAVVAADAFSCALLPSGGLRCWGANAAGQLGNGTFTNVSVPVDVVSN